MSLRGIPDVIYDYKQIPTVEREHLILGGHRIIASYVPHGWPGRYELDHIRAANITASQGFVNFFNHMAQAVYETMRANGRDSQFHGADELAETPSPHIPEFSVMEEEMASVIITVMETCRAHNWRVAEALLTKAEFNKSPR